MYRKLHWIGFIPLFLIIMATGGLSREYVIYTITQEVAMGVKDEKIKKNFYINLGKNQGVEAGTLLDVYRMISKTDPYNNNSRYNYKVKIGELRVIHSESNASIAQAHRYKRDQSTPSFEISDFMIGDPVNVHIEQTSP